MWEFKPLSLDNITPFFLHKDVNVYVHVSKMNGFIHFSFCCFESGLSKLETKSVYF